MISAALAILENEDERNELAEIYNQNVKTFYSIAFSRLHNQDDAEDAIQEAFLAIANNPDIFFRVPKQKRVSYLNVVIKNISCKMWNKKHNIKEHEGELNELISDERTLVEEHLLSNYSCQQIIDFMKTMPEITQTAIYLKADLEMNNSDISKVLGISEEATRKRIARAISQIKQFVETI